MKTSTLRTLPSTLLMVGFAAVFLSYADQPLYNWGIVTQSPADLFLGVMLLLTSGTLVGSLVSAPVRSRVIALYLAHPAVLIGLAGIACASFLSAFAPRANWGEGSEYVLFPAYDVIVVLFSMLLAFPKHRQRQFRVYFVIAFVLLMASLLIDATRPGTFSITSDRAAGFARNPNLGAFALVTLCCLIIAYDRVRLRDLVAIVATAVGVLATFSRTGAILLTLLLLCYTGLIASHARQPGRVIVRFAVVALTIAVVAQSAVVLVRRAELFSLSTSRLAMLTGRRTLLPERDPRRAALDVALRLARETPVFGLGSGFTATLPQGPHNIYLQQWINNGVPGLVAYLWLVGSAVVVFWQRRYHTGLVFMGLVLVYGLFSHNVLEDRAFLVPLGVLLTLSYARRGGPCAV